MAAGEVWTPRPYQEAVLEALMPRQRAALWAGCGTGKTVLAGTWLDAAMLDRCSVGKTLVVAPKLVVAGWLEQLARWRHLHGVLGAGVGVIGFGMLGLSPVRRPDGRKGELAFTDKRAAKRDILALPGRVHLCSWDAFPWVEEALGKAWPYDGLVLDEASFAKDQRSARGKAARRAVHKSGVVSHLLELTATPAANHQEAAYAQLDLVERGCLGENLTAFREEFCLPDKRDWSTGMVYSYKLAPAKQAEFDAVVRRLAISVPDQLGVEMLEVDQFVDLPDAAAAQYNDMRRDQVLDDVTAPSAAVLHLKLRQLAAGAVYTDAANAPARVVHTIKLEKLKELVECAEGPVLALYNFDFERAMLQSFGRAFADIRQASAKERFLRGELKVLGLHPASAGHGVDLLQTVCNQAIWMSPPVDAELHTQANGRLRRGGQKRTVIIHRILARGTIEEDIVRQVLPAKDRSQARMLRAAEVAC